MMFALFVDRQFGVVTQHPRVALSQTEADGGEKQGKRHRQTGGERDGCGGGDGACWRVHVLQLREGEMQGADRRRVRRPWLSPRLIIATAALATTAELGSVGAPRERTSCSKRSTPMFPCHARIASCFPDATAQCL